MHTITLFALMGGVIKSLPDAVILRLFDVPNLGVAVNLRMTKTLGLTRWQPGQVTVVLAAQVPPQVCQETVRHELAHVCAGPRARHGKQWRGWAVQCGAEPVAKCSDVSGVARDTWRVMCGSCGYDNRLLRSDLRDSATLCRRCGAAVPALEAIRSTRRHRYIVGAVAGQRYDLVDMIRKERFRRQVESNRRKGVVKMAHPV